MTEPVFLNSSVLPAAPAPLHHAARYGDLVLCSGQVALGADGTLVAGGAAYETRLVLENLGAVLESASSSLADVLRTTVYLTDLADYAEMNDVYAQVLRHRPARTCIQVAALPLGAAVEIDCIAAAR